ncbi:Putative oxidoreductase [Erythrobacter sp. NAP1]|nr:Putative oxidoreductase [Erythrobacter sp. NAP1]
MAAVLLMRDELKSKTAKQSILLTGGSGGLGSALALHHARHGIEISLWGRSMERLSETRQAVEKLGAVADTTSFDFLDAEAAVELMLAQDDAMSFDVAYFVAGIGDTRGEGDLVESPDQILRAIRLNLAAPAAMAAALAERMAERGGGRIVLIGSAAANHSLPFAAAYSASKAGLATFADALRIAVRPHGVSVTLAAPGFIDTAAGRNNSANRPFEIPVDEAARRIVLAAERGEANYVTPWQFKALKALDILLPRPIRDRFLERLSP